MLAPSPLRYPGGKGALADFLSEVIVGNGLEGGVYVEPYAGGAGAALSLLFSGHVDQIVLNDADPCIYAFWNAVLNRKDDLIRRIEDVPISIDEWIRQRDIYRTHARHSRIKVALATFYLNRCNRSGILVNGGPIGGIAQSGEWKLNARFNKDALIKRIEKINAFKGSIEVHNLDALVLLKRIQRRTTKLRRTLVYLDPPYYGKGSELYLNHYGASDHAKLATYIQAQKSFKWVMTYDDVPEIRRLYRSSRQFEFRLNYTANVRRRGKEVLICGGRVLLPPEHVDLLQAS